MKKQIIKMTALLLILIMSITMVACNDMEETSEDYEETDLVAETEDIGLVEETDQAELEEVEIVEVEIYNLEEVKQKLIDMLNIDESEITIEDSGKGSIMSYGDWEIWFYSYFLNDPNDSPEIFDIQTMIAEYDEKIVDEVNHKIWIEEEEEPGSYTMVAMKGNFVITIRSEVDRETIIETLNLE